MSLLKVLAFGGTAATAAVVGTASTTTPSSADTCTSNYEIQRGDTLLDIAYEQLGTVFAAQLLIDANPDAVGADPDLIFAGDRLTIPCERAVTRDVDWSVMPDVDTLAGLLRSGHVQVLDIRSHDQIGNGVIPGTIHVPYTVFQTHGAGGNSRPSVAEMSEIVGLSGLRLDQPIIIVNAKPSVEDLEQSGAIMNLLQSVGAEHVAILRHGYTAWVNAALPVVAFPELKDPYEITVSYSARASEPGGDLFAVAKGAGQSTYWQEVSPKPAHVDENDWSTALLVLARWAGN